MLGDKALIGSLMEDSWLTIEQIAMVCKVEPEWLQGHIQAGLFPGSESVAGVWRFSAVSIRRAKRMRALERDFDAVPELAALMADLLEELDEFRQRGS